ncbi:MAG: pseudouridine-5'-phosphate glycosidase [Bifidobacteriaceae bacterium]|jgi:pseudouridine-5'-phosphate glycosidase|nr:pseudouridine-5'-phosphate glycosidase [Bifidobacteriaceae bacterium]
MVVQNINIKGRKVCISAEVLEAQQAGKPVVALESTIISHGMPYPQNVQVALEVEDVVRKNGAVPATIAIINGIPTVGLSKEQIEHLGSEGPKIAKVSRRDMAIICSKGLDGATTVATTMLIARMADVKFFATGGIGGVHRGGELSMDISADLEEIARTEVVVVCAGAKSILDLPRTLEYLETKGVPVIGYGTDDLPAFYTNHSGIKLNARLDTPLEISEAFKKSEDLELGAGMLVTVPIPEENAMPATEINAVIDGAIKDAEAQGVHGKDTTPFLLARIKDVTGGKSLEANIALVKNNAKVASQIAVEYEKA